MQLEANAGECRPPPDTPEQKKAGARLLTPDLVAKSRGITAITRINSQANTEDIQTEGAWSISIGVKSNQIPAKCREIRATKPRFDEN